MWLLAECGADLGRLDSLWVFLLPCQLIFSMIHLQKNGYPWMTSVYGRCIFVSHYKNNLKQYDWLFFFFFSQSQKVDIKLRLSIECNILVWLIPWVAWGKLSPAHHSVSESANQPFCYHIKVGAAQGKSSATLQPSVERFEHAGGHKARNSTIVIILREVS